MTLNIIIPLNGFLIYNRYLVLELQIHVSPNSVNILALKKLFKTPTGI